ncbi:hypothetical protein Clacol_003244 [Clathrus columnatus]|uniref:Uncharacterized protein n=1 Tax=Clathrus columnatus TaxID=1419009 RepID=A0AAV5A726_9AGAM|nr:hypothetical protein Clacol_003244 [Clathrus columnatus]
MPTAAVITTSRTRRLSDPLSAALEPPPDETDAQREARLTSELSDSIDEQLRQEKEVLKAKARARQEIKVLLLGQSESGKSTTLKQFQLAYTPNSFRQERLAWRPVVYLNLVRSVRRVLDALLPQELQPNPLDDDEPMTPQHRDSISEGNRPPTAASITTNSAFATPKYTELKAQLQPLLDLEQDLVRRLSGGSTEDDEAIQLASPPSFLFSTIWTTKYQKQKLSSTTVLTGRKR